MVHTYAMHGYTARAKAAYQDFLRLWKDADPDIPILIAAKAEYAKLSIVRRRVGSKLSVGDCRRCDGYQLGR